MANPKQSTVNLVWYQTERNTEALMKAVVSSLNVQDLSGGDIRALMILTWITASKGQSAPEHWKRLKVPGLAHLFKTTADVTGDIDAAVHSMQLPPIVADAAIARTGFVNAYRAYRNSLTHWCEANKLLLQDLISAAIHLDGDNRGRLDIAKRISTLPRVSTPQGLRTMPAANFVTPLVACLDPKRRFPIVNGEHGVSLVLRKLGLYDKDLEAKVRGLMGLIGQHNINDAFALDTLGAEQIELVQREALQIKRPSGAPVSLGGSPLPELDEEERRATQDSGTVQYRARHNTMTNRLKHLLPEHALTQGDSQNCRFDVLIANLNRKGRDLLIEVKPDPDRGSLRVAIGQLFDYRRFMGRRAATDLAILTIGRPPSDYVELLRELQITCVWFTDAECYTMDGEGEAWDDLRLQIFR